MNEDQARQLYKIYEDINLSTCNVARGERWSQGQIKVCGAALVRFWEWMQENGIDLSDAVEPEDKL
jgi:hypothetical protein